MNDERFEKLLADSARDYNPPPENPREVMWERIQAARQEGPARRWRPLVLHGVGSRWVQWGVGIAAALAIGVGIGRFTGRAPSPVVPVEGSAVAAASQAAAEAYQWVAAEHLGQVERFLTMFRVEARLNLPVMESSGSARELLSTTRLLIDSPAADDADVKELLDDIELVLAQIALFSSRRDSRELDFIDQSIEQRAVLLRLRAALPSEPELTVEQGVL